MVCRCSGYQQGNRIGPKPKPNKWRGLKELMLRTVPDNSQRGDWAAGAAGKVGSSRHFTQEERMTMKAIAFAVDQAPKGGYKLTRITGFDAGGAAEMQVVAYCSTLVEAQMIELSEKQELFGERAWYPQHQPSYIPPPPAAASPELDGSLPKFARDYADGGGMMGELYNRTNGVARALMPMLFLAGIWFANHARFMV